MIESLLFSLSAVSPTFILLSVGIISKQFNFINENFVSVTSRFAFNISLPVLIFMQISALNLKQTFNTSLIIFIYSATIILIVLIWLLSLVFVKEVKDRGVFVQGSFRGNFAIMGFSLLSNLLGKDCLGKASIILSLLLPLYNIFTVIVLTIYQKNDFKIQPIKILREILYNPLIVSVIVGVIFSYFELKLPKLFSDSAKLISDLALPLALIAIGGSLDFKEIGKTSRLALISSSIKIIIIPLIVTPIAYLLNFRNDDIIIIYILFGSPTAIVSFIMAEAMGNGGKLAGNIILISTIGSIFTFSIGIMILKSLSLL